MGLYGSPDVGNLYTKKKEPEKKSKEPRLKKILLWCMIAINVFPVIIGGFNILNILTILVVDCVIIFIYSVISLVYNMVKKNSIKNNVLGIAVSFIGFFVLALVIGSTQEYHIEDLVHEDQIIKNKETYIPLAETYNYKDIERNPENYKGKIAVFSGRVIQVFESGSNKITYRVDIKNTEGDWADTIYVSYTRPEGEPRVLVDDIITLYGELDGVETYTSVMAGNITIPSIIARYIDINE